MRKFQSDDPLMAYVVRYFAEYQAVVLEDEYGDPHLENNWFPAVFAYYYDAIVASVPFYAGAIRGARTLAGTPRGIGAQPGILLGTDALPVRLCRRRLPKPARDAEKREGDVSRFAGFSREQRPDEADHL